MHSMQHQQHQRGHLGVAVPLLAQLQVPGQAAASAVAAAEAPGFGSTGWAALACARVPAGSAHWRAPVPLLGLRELSQGLMP